MPPASTLQPRVRNGILLDKALVRPHSAARRAPVELPRARAPAVLNLRRNRQSP